MLVCENCTGMQSPAVVNGVWSECSRHQASNLSCTNDHRCAAQQLRLLLVRVGEVFWSFDINCRF